MRPTTRIRLGRIAIVLLLAAVASAADLATVQLSPGWATFGQAAPRGAARSLRIGALPTQCDIKTRWDDGSIRFAVLTAPVVTAGAYDVAPTTPSTATALVPRATAAEVRLDVVAGTSRTLYTARLPAARSTDRWLDGAQVVEERHRLRALDAAGAAHPFLTVLIDLRTYRDGSRRLDVAVENILDQAGARPVTYSVAIVADGVTHWSHADVTHFYLTRWRRTLPLGLTESDVRLDLRPFFAARALPRYLDLVLKTIYHPAGTYGSTHPRAGKAKFDILEGGDLNPDMTAHGGRAELAPYPDWTASYLVHQDSVQKRYVLAAGDTAGSWGVHVREPDGGTHAGIGDSRLVCIDQRPNYWLDAWHSGAYPWSKAADGTWIAGGAVQRAMPPHGPAGSQRIADRGFYYADIAHQPSLAYVPYLVTGDRWYADEVRYWANYCLLATFQDAYYNARGGSAGIMLRNETRGIAWAIRNVSDAAAYLPDGDPARPYLAQKLMNTLRALDARAATPGPLGVAWLGYRNGPVSPTTQLGVALWEHAYLTWAIDHAVRHGFDAGKDFRDQVSDFQLRLFTTPGYDRAFAGPYNLAVADRTSTTTTWYTSLPQVFQRTYGTSGAAYWWGYNGPDARLMLLIAARNGRAGTQGALDYLMTHIGVPNSTNTVAVLARRSGWSIAADDPTRDGTGTGTGAGTGTGTTAGGSSGSSSGSGSGGGSGGDASATAGGATPNASGGSGGCGTGGALALALAAISAAWTRSRRRR